MLRNITLRLFATLLISIISFQITRAQLPNVTYSAPVITGLSSPLDIVNAGDGTNRLFVVERGGAIKIYSAAYAPIGTLVTVTGIVAPGGFDERGLLSLAFHPDYETNRFFYVYYNTLVSGVNYVNLARYQTRADNPNLADDTSRKVMLSIPKNFTNHNGGRIQFGQDGYLYLSTGDGGSGNDPDQNGQNGGTLLGKILRLDPNVGATAYVSPYYTVPADNPYVSDPNITRKEIYALGLRNPYRWSFDRLTGDMWIGDVGQAAREEINYRAAGPPAPLNFGWRCFEGTIPTPGIGSCTVYGTHTPPIYDYPNPGTGASVTGGHVYRGPDYGALQGVYIAADVYSGRIYKIRSNGAGGWTVDATQTSTTNIVGFGEAENGRLFAVTLGGSVLQVTTTSTLPVKITNFNALRRNTEVEVSWKTTYESGLKEFQLEYSVDGRSYQSIATLAAVNSANGAAYAHKHLPSAGGTVYYRLKVLNTDNSFEISPVLTIQLDKPLTGASIPSLVRNNRLVFTLYEPYNMLRVISPSGGVVLSRNVAGMNGVNDISLPELPSGVYIIQLTGNGRPFSGRIVVNQ